MESVYYLLETNQEGLNQAVSLMSEAERDLFAEGVSTVGWNINKTMCFVTMKDARSPVPQVISHLTALTHAEAILIKQNPTYGF